MHYSQKMITKTQKFIETVKRYPVIYDPSHPNYKHRIFKHRAWMDISKVMGDNYVLLRNKWKNLRDSYTKYLRVQDPHCHGFKMHKKYLRWPWAPYMEFIRPILEGVPQLRLQNTTSRSPSPETSVPPTEIHIKTEDTTDAAEDSVPRGLEEYDGTDLIFLGYSKIVKKMSALRQASTRYKIAQILMEAEVEQIHEDEEERGTNIIINSLTPEFSGHPNMAT